MAPDGALFSSSPSLVRAGLVFHFLCAMFGFLRGLVRAFLYFVAGLVGCLLGGVSSVLGGLLGLVTRIFHVLLSGVLRPAHSEQQSQRQADPGDQSFHIVLLN